MTGILVANSIMLGIGAVSIVILIVLLTRSERKLARHDESWMFKRKDVGGKK